MKPKLASGIGTLLTKNISKGQLLGYFFANLIGLTVILSGILFYCDSRHHRNTHDKYFSDDYIIVSKKVKGVNLEPVAFSEDEINKIKTQPWVKKLGRFTTADFSINASINMGGKGLSSYLFFESVPDEFFDTPPMDWGFDSSKKFVPIVLNRDYLALYNFGFAIPQGLPQLSEEMIGTIPLKLLIRGKNDRSAIFDAGVVGFSSRLNTIAVPQEFMDWANKEFSKEERNETSRLILEIDRINSSDSDKFIQDNGLEIAGDKESDSKISEFLGVVSGVVSATGVVIAMLALFILLLSIFLLLQKSREMLRNLMLLGYSPSQISKYYERLLLIINALITSLAIGFTFICRLIWHDSLIVLGLGDGNVLFMLGGALIYFILVSALNISVTRQHLYSIWST